MRPTFILAAAARWLVAAALAGGPARAAPAPGPAYHIVGPMRALGAGEHVALKLVPPPPDGARLAWSLAAPDAASGPDGATYRAPWVIPAGAPAARVGVGFSAAGQRRWVTADIELLPGSVPGAEDCLGPGQSFAQDTGDIVPAYTYLDDLPQLVERVEPEYPRSAFARGVEDTITVRALLCRSGRVLDAWAPAAFRGPGLEPVGHDPALVEAAIAAVRAWVFTPGRLGGQAVASWIDVPVAFRR